MSIYDQQLPMMGTNYLYEYLVDGCQRSILYWDIMRQRGNQYLEHQGRTVPHVLDYEVELIMNGRKLENPVNYGLVKIILPKGVEIDARKRPFVIVDPRAGHGPGIGGFKADSEIGVAMGQGHPCYFIGFSPVPEPGQTIEKILHAEAQFIRRVGELHPDADGKPIVIGNCQAGWAVLMMASAYPELCGPIIVAGAPVSYWAGVHGENPMRYTGGMLGGSWLTALTGDAGAGLFDGAWLVMNMEGLNPANTLWTKQYTVYAKADTEGPRYLGFERWWGGHVLLTAEEMQYIVDNLFIGNKLSTAQINTTDGRRLDLRNITSPIICFCSKGDNITPPQQALGWILDLYESVDDIRCSGQTIIYAVHDRIGHLGIFVSGGVARKEHFEFASNIDFIDCLPPGLYEAVITGVGEDTANVELVTGDYISRFEKRTLDDIRALGVNSPEDERAFAAVSRLSDITHGLYRSFAAPLVRGAATAENAEFMRHLHPLRMSYEIFSDLNPFMKPFASAAQWVKGNRQPVSPDNPFLMGQQWFSQWLEWGLDSFRDWRDTCIEQSFYAIYNQPLLQAMLGLRANDEPPRPIPGQEPDHIVQIEKAKQELLARVTVGGVREALIRALIYVRIPEGAADERGFEMITRIRDENPDKLSLSNFKEVVREQFYIVLLDEERAVETIPALLADGPESGEELFALVERVATASGKLGDESKKRLAKIQELFVGAPAGRETS
jgi:pimeloyl-ACP methyl ester carboxylesterase